MNSKCKQRIRLYFEKETIEKMEMKLIIRMFTKQSYLVLVGLEEKRKEAVRHVRRTRGKIRLADLFKRKDAQSL